MASFPLPPSLSLLRSTREEEAPRHHVCSGERVRESFCLFSKPAEEEEEEREKCRRWRDSIEGIDRAQSFLQSSTSRASPCSVFLPVRVLPHGSHSHAEAHWVLESPPKTQTKTQNSQEETAEAVAALSVGEEEAAAAGASAGAPGGADAASGSAKPKKEKPKKEK